MWGSLLTFLENYIIGKIESNAGHPDQFGWIKQALNLIALVGSSTLEAYAVPRLEVWIKQAAASGNPIEHQLVELAVSALVKNGGEIGKIVGEADALADAPAPTIAEAVAPVEPTPTEPAAEALETPVVEATEPPLTEPEAQPETPPTGTQPE